MSPTDSDFEAKFTLESEANPLVEEPPFHTLMLGDWSGIAPKKDLSTRKPIVVDRDNFDDVIRNLKVCLALDLNDDGNALTIQFNEIDDFHPDNLFRQVSLFGDLRDVRRRLLNADSFNEAARQVRAWFNVTNQNIEVDETQESSSKAIPVDSDNLLDQILSQPSEITSVKTKKIDNSDLGRFLSKIVSPYLVNIDENEQSKLISVVDDATSDLMRKILHHPQFQALESAWRGLYFLVRHIETEVDLKIFIFDIAKDELSDNLKKVNSLADSFLYRLLFEGTSEVIGDEFFALICGNYSFGVNVDDIATLMRLAKLAHSSNSPFISHVYPEMFGIQTFSEEIDFSNFKFSENSNEGKLWLTLRALPESDSLGLFPLRLLIRLPYGELTDSTETFSFEELTGDNLHKLYLWTNPCFAGAFLLMQSYRLNGWDMAQNLSRDIEGLPMHLYRENEMTKIKPCAEIVLTENLAEQILQQGLMPLISYRNTDRVTIPRFQSIANPLKWLNSKWSP